MSIVKSLSVGNGDMYYIRHNSDNFTVIDCCMPDARRDQIMDEIIEESADKGIFRFISTHPDQDHICGLADLHSKKPISNFYCVLNQATKRDFLTRDFLKYCELRDDPSKAFYIQAGCQRKWMNVSDEQRGRAGLNVVWPLTANIDYQAALRDAADGRCPNNMSTIFTYSVESSATFLWMGDLETGFMEDIESAVVLPKADILFAPHHGRESGRVPTSWLKKIDPKIIVVGEAPSLHLHYYPGYETMTQNSAGDITFEALDGCVNVYVSDGSYSVDYLTDLSLPNRYGRYIGTLLL